jgi:hypothetical protein
MLDIIVTELLTNYWRNFRSSEPRLFRSRIDVPQFLQNRLSESRNDPQFGQRITVVALIIHNLSLSPNTKRGDTLFRVASSTSCWLSNY